MGSNDRIDSEIISGDTLDLLWAWADAELGHAEATTEARHQREAEAAMGDEATVDVGDDEIPF